MDLYSVKARATGAKLFITTTQLVFILIAALILFGPLQSAFATWPGVSSDQSLRRTILIIFSLITLVRFSLMMFVFLKRAIGPAEMVSVPAAFFIYYVGFSILVLPYGGGFDIFDLAGIVLFVVGAGLNTMAEYERHRFKADPANAGKLYTGGLFSRAMHINYFGDILWVSGYALVAHHPVGFVVPVALAVFFAFGNIPMLDKHLAKRYGAAFDAYAAKTKKLVPGIW